MRTDVYQVDANWDPEAGVWYATSDNVPGLVTEADSIELFTEKLRVMIPELLEANGLIRRDEPGTITFELRSHREELVRLAS